MDHYYLVDSELLDTIANEVSGERAWDMVSKISRFHRIRGGGEGSDYNRCVEWLAEELKKIGLKEVNIKEYRADGFKKYFLWDSPVGWKVNEAELWLLEPIEKLLARFSDQAVSLMPYSQGGEVECEVVQVGQGKSDADYKDKDVKGKIVFAVGGSGNEVHNKAVLERGAKGVVVGPSDREDRLLFADLVEVNRLSPTGEERKNTGFGFSISRRQEKELISFFSAGKKVIMRAKVEAELFDGNMPVLEAKIIGREYPSQEILITAHLDHYKPGANDNASGSAGIVEIIRNILKLIERGKISPLKRTIRFLWLPEMYGTVAYLNEHPDLKEKGIAAMNLDMIGEDYALCQSRFSLTCSPYSVPGYIDDILINLLSWLEGPVFFSPRGGRHRFNFRVKPYSGGSDHIMFNSSPFLIPTTSLGHKDVFHHTNMDTPDKCDPTELKRIISLTEAASIILANADDEDALKIAREVYSNANIRMMERTKKSLQLLHHNASDPTNRGKLAELYSNIINYPQVHAQIESANLLEVNELCQKEASKIAIKKLAEDLYQQAIIEKKKTDDVYELILNIYNLKKEQFLSNNIYKKASSLKPKKLFEGPFVTSANYLKEILGDERFNWYEQNKKKAGENYTSKIYEIINLMDSNRTLLDIRHIISCEYDETNIEFVLNLARNLEAIGLVKFD